MNNFTACDIMKQKKVPDSADISFAFRHLQEAAMGKPGESLMKKLHEYSETSTVHGVSYIFSRSLPQVDRLLWTFLTTTW